MDKNLTLDDAVEFLVDIQGAFNRTDQQQICNDICHDKVNFPLSEKSVKNSFYSFPNLKVKPKKKIFLKELVFINDYQSSNQWSTQRKKSLCSKLTPIATFSVCTDYHNILLIFD